jgi:phosphatidylethanolamine-binding protein (PEBP) family uncharacterized protein
MKRRLSFGLALCFATALGCGDDTDPSPPTYGKDAAADGGESSSTGNNSSSKPSSSSGGSSSGGSSSGGSSSGSGGTTNTSDPEDSGAFSISSPNFDDGEALPNEYTCEGEAFGAGYSPQLAWSGIPAGTKRLALVFKDTTIEAAGGDNQFRAYHWVAWDIPITVTGIPEHLSIGDQPEELEGGSQFRAGPPHDNEFFGPCPSWRAYACPDYPRVTDEYAFVLYAFDDENLEYPAPGERYAQVLADFLEANKSASTVLTATSNAKPTSSPAPCDVIDDAGTDGGVDGDAETPVSSDADTPIQSDAETPMEGDAEGPAESDAEAPSASDAEAPAEGDASDAGN